MPPTDKPEMVTISPVNATAVTISWSGSTHLHTRLQYTTHCSPTGSVVSQHVSVVDPGVSSAVITTRDDITLGVQYDHHFTLQYITTNDVTPPAELITMATFSFGNKLIFHNSCTPSIFPVSKDKQYLQLQFGPIDYCLNWGVS